MDPCIYCQTGLHWECDGPTDEVNPDACCCETSTDRPPVKGDPITKVLGGWKADDAVTDPTSTGRKRAAQLKPIIDGMECDWAGLAYAGGGPYPIVGCYGITLVKEKGQGDSTGNLHHGPDKSTLNNNDNNLHRVCGRCHNRWHTLNDPFYPKDRPAHGEPFVPVDRELRAHDKRTEATASQIDLDMQWWMLPVAARPDYREFVDALSAESPI